MMCDNCSHPDASHEDIGQMKCLHVSKKGKKCECVGFEYFDD